MQQENGMLLHRGNVLLGVYSATLLSALEVPISFTFREQRGNNTMAC